MDNYRKCCQKKIRFKKKLLKDEAIVKSLSQKKYENITEIKAVLKCEQKKLKYHNLVWKNLEKITDKKNNIVYTITIALELKSEKIEEEQKKAGRFILATNILNKLSP